MGLSGGWAADQELLGWLRVEQLAEGIGPREERCATIQHHDQINGMAWCQGRLMVEPERGVSLTTTAVEGC